MLTLELLQHSLFWPPLCSNWDSNFFSISSSWGCSNPYTRLLQFVAIFLIFLENQMETNRSNPQLGELGRFLSGPSNVNWETKYRSVGYFPSYLHNAFSDFSTCFEDLTTYFISLLLTQTRIRSRYERVIGIFFLLEVHRYIYLFKKD